MDEKELYEYKFTVIDEDIDEIDATLKKHENRLDKHEEAIKESLIDRAKLNQSLAALTKVLWYLATAIVGLLIANIVQDFLMMK
ncbi:MAG: hypothetical protein ACOXZ0_05065 [Eubacteriales bacterium]|jgi:septal ring factor EnvC (AmiA/AmiB activator)